MAKRCRAVATGAGLAACVAAAVASAGGAGSVEAAQVDDGTVRPVDGLAAPVTITGDGIEAVLPGAVPGDPARGRAIVASRQTGLCLLCHAAPIPEERFQGDLATDLAGVGLRATAAQLRLRIVDARRVNPETIMPAYFRIGGLDRVATQYRGRPILEAQQIEDVVAWLLTLREPPGQAADGAAR